MTRELLDRLGPLGIASDPTDDEFYTLHAPDGTEISLVSKEAPEDSLAHELSYWLAQY